MTDEEMTKRCAEAMGMSWEAEQKRMADRDGKWLSGYETPRYDPLVNDEQAMALVKRFPVHCIDALDNMIPHGPMEDADFRHLDINRVIVECVAKMHAASTRSAKT